MKEQWIKVTDKEPELDLPLMGYDDDGNREVIFENHHAIVLGWNEELGVFKAEFDKHRRWSEISSLSIKGGVQPDYWMPLPKSPNYNQSNT